MPPRRSTQTGQQDVPTTPKPTDATSPEPAAPPVAVEAAPEPELPLPTNVVAAIARVMAEIGGIRKMSQAERRRLGLMEPGAGSDDFGVKYAYRGIDQVAAAAQPLLGKYGVVIIPTVLDQSIANITVKDKPWTDTFVEVQWDMYGPGGVTDKLVAITTGVGRDNSDKGVNKAMTTAFKNLLLRILCIGDPADETDAVRHETDAMGEPVDPRPDKHPADVLFERVRDASDYVKVHIKVFAQDAKGKLSSAAFRENAEWMQAVTDKMKALEAVAAQDAVVDVSQIPEPPGVEPDADGTRCPHCGAAEFFDAMAYEDHLATHDLVAEAMAPNQ